MVGSSLVRCSKAFGEVVEDESSRGRRAFGLLRRIFRSLAPWQSPRVLESLPKTMPFLLMQMQTLQRANASSYDLTSLTTSPTPPFNRSALARLASMAHNWGRASSLAIRLAQSRTKDAAMSEVAVALE